MDVLIQMILTVFFCGFVVAGGQYVPDADCTTTSMTCISPVHDNTVSTYTLQGDSVCSTINYGGTVGYVTGSFSINFAACELAVTRSISGDHVKVTAVIEFSWTNTPLVTDLSEPPPMAVTCECLTDAEATGGDSSSVQTVNHASDIRDYGYGTFSVSASFYGSDSFSSSVSTFGSTDSNMYVEISSDQDVTQDQIGLGDCYASPSSFSDTGSTRTLIYSIAASRAASQCEGGVLGLTPLAESPEQPGVIRFSLTNFKFGGESSIYLWCEVDRCIDTEAECNPCDLGGGVDEMRRLQGNGTSSSGNTTQPLPSRGVVDVGVVTASGVDVVVLPSSLLHSQQAFPQWQTAVNVSDLGDQYVVTNLTLFGSINTARDELASVAMGVAKTMSNLLAREVQAVTIFAFTEETTGVGNLHVDAIMVEVMMSWADRNSLAQMRRLLDSTDFRNPLTSGLNSHTPGMWPYSLSAEFGPLWLRDRQHHQTSSGTPGKSDSSDMGAFIAVAAGSLVVGIALASFAIYLRRSCRRPQANNDQKFEMTNTQKAGDEGTGDVEGATDSMESGGTKMPESQDDLIFDVRMPAGNAESATQRHIEVCEPDHLKVQPHDPTEEQVKTHPQPVTVDSDMVDI